MKATVGLLLLLLLLLWCSAVFSLCKSGDCKSRSLLVTSRIRSVSAVSLKEAGQGMMTRASDVSCVLFHDDKYWPSPENVNVFAGLMRTWTKH